ncbi:MAG TPA: hypothetical protein DEB06_11405 [Phycisphaerales bacterium]|nr:hypothetical protein [Phycisphaerales bacterium]
MPRANLLGPGTAHSCVVAELAPGALFAHPYMSFYADERAARWRPSFVEVESRIEAELSAGAGGMPVQGVTVLLGSATFSRFQDSIPDLDLHTRLRYRLASKPRSLEEGQALVAEAYRPFLLGLIERVRSTIGWRLVRLRTEWNSSVIDRRRHPQNLMLNWSPADLAIGSTVGSTGEITLSEALMCSGSNKVTFLMPGPHDDEPLMVDLQIDRGWTAPGGDCDINPDPTGQWFGKLAASRGAAERAVAMEREMASLFPALYRVPECYLGPMGVNFVDRLARGELAKLGRIPILAWSYLGRRDMVERVIEVVRGRRLDLMVHFGVLGNLMQIARKHELPNGVIAPWVIARLRRAQETVGVLTGGRAEAIGPALTPLVRAGASDPSAPGFWRLVNEFLRVLRDRLNAEMLEELRAQPELLDVFPGARRALGLPGG